MNRPCYLVLSDSDNAVRALREATGLSVTAFAERMGAPKWVVQELERRHEEISLHQFMEHARAAGVTVLVERRAECSVVKLSPAQERMLRELAESNDNAENEWRMPGTYDRSGYVLADLGLVKRHDHRVWSLTDAGRTRLREIEGSSK